VTDPGHSGTWIRYAVYAVIGEVALTLFFRHGTALTTAGAALLATVTVVATAMIAAILTRRFLLALRVVIVVAVAWVLPMLWDLVTDRGVYGWSDLPAPAVVVVVLVAGERWSSSRRRAGDRV
jgi:hypothetical protein